MEEFRVSDMRRKRREEETSTTPKRAYRPSEELREEKRIDPSAISSTKEKVVIESPQVFEEVTLRQYYEIILRYRKIVLIITFSLFSISIISSFFQPDKYRAQVELLKKEEIINRMDPFSNSRTILSIETIAKIALSRPVLEKAVMLLPLYLKKIEINSKEKIPSKDWQKLKNIDAGTLAHVISARIDRTSQDILIIECIFKNSRFLTAAVVNAVAFALQERINELNRKEALQKCKIISQLQEIKQAEIKEIENQILNLRKEQEKNEEAFTAIAADQEYLLKLLSEYEMLYQKTLLKKEELEKQILSIKKELGIANIPFENVVWIDTSHALYMQLQRLKVKREELLTRYTEKNPLVKKIDLQIRNVENMLNSSVFHKSSQDKVVVHLDPVKVSMLSNLILYKAELRGIENQLKSIKKTRDDLNNKLIELPVKTIQIERLKRQKEVLQKLSEELSRQYQQEKIKSASHISNIEIIELAVPPHRPFSPNRKKIGALGLFLGLILGIVSAFMLNHWDNTINSTLEIKRILNLTPLGLIPMWEEEDKYISPLRLDASNAEVYSVLRNNIRYSNADNPQKCLLLASAIQREGKSLTAINLAISYTLEGNSTLLIAMDLRQERSYRSLRLTQEPKTEILGVSDFLTKDLEYSDIILETDIENLYVIPSGKKPKNPSRVLSSPKLKQLLVDMQKQFDVVIIDAPAILPVVDTTIISPLVKGVLLVIEAGRTPIGACQQAINRLEHVNSIIIGAVLNKAKDMRFDYFYGYGYNYYGREQHYKV